VVWARAQLNKKGQAAQQKGQGSKQKGRPQNKKGKPGCWLAQFRGIKFCG